MVEKAVDLALPAPEVLAQEIFDQALTLTARLVDLVQTQGQEADAPFLQEALIQTGQSLLLGLSESLKRHLPPEQIEDFTNQVFLSLGRLTLMEFIQREPSGEEWEYFLTYFRSHFELLRKEMQDLGQEEGEETLPQEAQDLLAEARRHLEGLLTRLFA